MRVTEETIIQRMRLGDPLFTTCDEIHEKGRCLSSSCRFSLSGAAYMLCYVSRIAESIKRKREES